MEDSHKLETIAAWLGTGSINIFGRPFSGKDTQGRMLAEQFGGILLGGGEILRNSVIPEDIKTLMKNGILIPIDAYIDIVLPYLEQASLSEKPLILSSVGRWHGEEDGVLAAAQQSGHPVKAVIYLDLDELTVRDRWALLHVQADRGHRHDDTEEILETRLNEYRNKTLPVIEHYKDLGLLLSIDGNRPREQVYGEIIEQLYAHAMKQ